eukprot:COSAG02_NODE_561_length_20308_cov_42.799495_19_plen_87_part_00
MVACGGVTVPIVSELKNDKDERKNSIKLLLLIIISFAIYFIIALLGLFVVVVTCPWAEIPGDQSDQVIMQGGHRCVGSAETSNVRF